MKDLSYDKDILHKHDIKTALDRTRIIEPVDDSSSFSVLFIDVILTSKIHRNFTC
jgi:hypothetical protein